MPQLSQLESGREAIAEYLRGLGAFSGVEVFTRKDGHIIPKVETMLGKVGVCVEVFIKSARPKQNQGWAVIFDPAVFGLAVYENVLVNQDPVTGTGKGAFVLVESALAALKQWVPPGTTSVLMPDPDGPKYGISAKQPTLLILTVDFSTIVQLPIRPA